MACKRRQSCQQTAEKMVESKLLWAHHLLLASVWGFLSLKSSLLPVVDTKSHLGQCLVKVMKCCHFVLTVPLFWNDKHLRETRHGFLWFVLMKNCDLWYIFNKNSRRGIFGLTKRIFSAFLMYPFLYFSRTSASSNYCDIIWDWKVFQMIHWLE